MEACKLPPTTISSTCPKCGTGKSGKMSCCAHGGSWFRNCGRSGNVKLRHTWYEGIQACKTPAQSKKASGRQSNAAQRLNSPNGVDTGNSADDTSREYESGKKNFKTITMTRTKIISTPAITPMTNTS